MSGSQDDNLTIYEDGGTLGNGDLVTAYKEFEDPESVDCSLLLGPADATVQSILVDICDARKDCIAFLSPVKSSTDPAGLVQDKTTEDAAKAVVNFRDNTLNKSSSFAVLDSGFKVMLDPYNDVLRHVPLNGDIAGLCARTEQEQEAWFSPAEFNRVKLGVVKLDLTQDKHKETNSLQERESTLLFRSPEREPFSLVIRLCKVNHLRLTESTCVVCSSCLKSNCNCR